MLKGLNVVIHFLSKVIQVIQLRLLGFHKSMSVMRNEVQLLFNLEHPVNDWVLAIDDLTLLN